LVGHLFQNSGMNDKALRDHLLYLLRDGGAHAGLEDSVKGVPAELRGERPRGLPHSPWELLEHIRIAQWDILEFSRNRDHKSPKWPEGYWPKSPEPPNASAWSKSVRAIRDDLEAMCALVSDPATDLFKPIEWGDGQTILREALLVADHNSYHLGQLVATRRLLGAWK
jgi:DinB superfamily